MDEVIDKIPLVRLQMIRDKEIPYGREMLNTPEKAAAFMRKFLQNADREYLIVCCVDTKCHPVLIEVVGIGTVNECLTVPRELFKSALLSNASDILLFHNHPSGIADPSVSDYALTERLKEAGELLGVPLLDHIILGDDAFYSFKEQDHL